MASRTGISRFARTLIGLALAVLVVLPTVGAANERAAAARREASKKINALLWHNNAHVGAAEGKIIRLLSGSGGNSARALAIAGLGSLDNPVNALSKLQKQLKWALNINPKELARHGPHKYRYEENLRIAERYRSDLLKHMFWLEDLIKSRVILHRTRKALDQPIEAARAIRDVRAVEKLHQRAYEKKLVDRSDQNTFKMHAIRLRWALGIIANTKSKSRPKCIAIIKGAGHPDYCVVSKHIQYRPVDGHLAHVTWELVSFDNVPVRIGQEIQVVANLRFANGKPIGRRRQVYRGSKTQASWRKGATGGARLTFHWDIPCKYWAVISPMGTKGSGAAVTIKPSGIPKKGKSCVPLFVWAPTGIPGDWAGGDWHCSEGAKPWPRFCDSDTVGTVAVCWKGRRTGHPKPMCKGLAIWCTYKRVKVSTRQNGTAPGTVYECRKFRITPR